MLSNALYFGGARCDWSVTPTFTFGMDFAEDVNSLDLNDPSQLILNDQLFQATTQAQIEAINERNVFEKDGDVELMFAANFNQGNFVTTQDDNTLYSHYIPASTFTSVQPATDLPIEYRTFRMS